MGGNGNFSFASLVKTYASSWHGDAVGFSTPTPMLSSPRLQLTAKKPSGRKYSREWLSGFPGPSDWWQEFGVSKNENDHCVYLQKYFVGLLSWGRWQMGFQRKGTNCGVPNICSFSLSYFILYAIQWALLFSSKYLKILVYTTTMDSWQFYWLWLPISGWQDGWLLIAPQLLLPCSACSITVC